jgi:hypothetical protein
MKTLILQRWYDTSLEYRVWHHSNSFALMSWLDVVEGAGDVRIKIATPYFLPLIRHGGKQFIHGGSIY